MFMPRGAEISSLGKRGRPSICDSENGQLDWKSNRGRVWVKNDRAKRACIVSREMIGRHPFWELTWVGPADRFKGENSMEAARITKEFRDFFSIH
jgi:hypothetical protein